MAIDVLLVLVLLYGAAKVAPRAISDMLTTARASKAGQWGVIDRERDRRAAAAQRRGERLDRMASAWAARRTARNEAAGGRGDPGPGLRRYVGTVWRGVFEDMEKRHTAKRANRPPYDPNRPTMRDRWGSAVKQAAQRARTRHGAGSGSLGRAATSAAARVRSMRGRVGSSAAGGAMAGAARSATARFSRARAGAGRATGGTTGPTPKPGQGQSNGRNGSGTTGATGGQVINGDARPTPTTNGAKATNGAATQLGRTSIPLRSAGQGATTTGKENNTMAAVTQAPTATSGEPAGVVSGHRQASNIRLVNVGLRDAMQAQLDQLLAIIDANAAGAANFQLDARTQASIAQAREAIMALKALLVRNSAEVDAAMAGVVASWAKHLRGVEFNSATGGIGTRRAYSGN